MTNAAQRQVPWVALVGRREDGRGVLAAELATRLGDHGFRLGGFLQHPIEGSQPGEHSGYEAENLHSGQRVQVATHGDDPEVCDWCFDDDAFAEARRWVLDPNADVSFVELGPLESKGAGHLPAARAALDGSAQLLVFCIRPHVLASIGLGLPDPVDGVELPAERAEIEAFCARVEALARRSGDHE